MDQIQEQLDPEIAQEVITLLNRKIAGLRSENAQLQDQLSRPPAKEEDESQGSSNGNTRNLLAEVQHWKSESERRLDPGEVAELEEKLKRSKRRRQELEQSLQSQIEQLRTELEETRSAKEELEKDIEALRKDPDQREEAPTRSGFQPSDSFNVHQFLNSTLEEPILAPRPIVLAGEGRPRFKGTVIRKIGKKFTLSANGDGTVKWANKGGGCVVPLPPVIYNGRKDAVEKSRWAMIENCSYELFGVDRHCTYYGSYRCVRLVTMDWSELTSFGLNEDEFVDAFLESTVVQDGHASPVIQTLVRNMYKTGILKAGCAVFRYEGFDESTAGEVEGTKIRNVLLQKISSKRRPDPDDHNVEGAKRKGKKPKLKGDKAQARASPQVAMEVDETGDDIFNF